MGTVTIINITPHKLQPVPEVGKEYHIFDDGKIKPSRHYIAKVIEIIPALQSAGLYPELYDAWQRELADYDWLFAVDTDYFIKAETTAPTYEQYQYFVRTVDGGWFSMGWWASRLDIDGSLYEEMKENYNVKE